MEALTKRKDTVKLLILSLLLNGLNQREIARRLGLTPQAISEYFKELSSEGFVKNYEITEKGLRWLIERIYEIHVWSENILKNLYSEKVVAIAVGRVRKGDKVRYWFDTGLIYCKVSEDYNAVALTDGENEEILIKPIAFKPPERGKVTVFVVPDVTLGGSKAVDVQKISELAENKVVVALGVEALVACRKASLNPVFFGAKCCCVEAVHHGCDVLVVCAQSLLNDLIQTLIDEGIEYKILK
ncbi:DUF7839 domain-containing protein [Archaeoglobus profundus]|uniref:Transcriptional regulator protein-like protein n=1 Tax=Archaeoglobus profundus (strain DSM 5631 / JCM 9629 / NBRC 100127 / Av18) TaxID=572546 RepID=D2RFI8_ARCPA|nr:winged helix-turn-helix transcriptional regulator [Archaeoglobus profundus]ADB58882.1 transcriptional regulator protein-like protein [Archaeoglobus profundus DSM 5631]